VTGSSNSGLSELQRQFLQAFSGRSSAFFLTGGAVLAGWVLAHRRTDDLDLFTIDGQAMAGADRLPRATAADIGASVESVQSSPDFKRYLLRAGAESVIVALVRERVAQLHPKVVRDGVLTDSVEEIVANKICAVVGRSEIRDLVDLYFLDRSGFHVENFLGEAARKDAGVTAATLAWILSNISLPDSLAVGVDPTELRNFVRDLEARMRRLALP